jgi:carbonic anhydrase
MKYLADLLERNRVWASGRQAKDPKFFDRLCDIQQPTCLWIGCSDSRVSANAIVGTAPGEMFVHRNVANIVAPGDTNCMAAVQYAVERLDVRHIIVCGHYGCGGVRAVLEGGASEVPSHIQRWLSPLKHLAAARSVDLAEISDPAKRWRRLCELNVVEQVQRLLASDVLINAGLRGVEVIVHGWIYDLRDGLLCDLRVSRSASECGSDGVGRE